MDWARLEPRFFWGLLVATFLGVAIWESYLPKRKLTLAAESRWGRHSVLMLLSIAVGIFILRISPVALTAATQQNRFGLLNRPWLPFPIRFGAAILLLDLLQYGVHWTFHHVGILWRVHEVHHSDPDFDVSTAVRFHPIETLITQGALLAAIVLLAPPVSGVFFAEMLKMTLNLLEHANASLPEPLEKLVRLGLITPDLHRIHHSDDEREQNRNLGQIFSWWDRLFGTFKAQPYREWFATGLKGFQNGASVGIGFMLGEPFRGADKQKDPAI
jgi:sterol desaturase/sphingolipid hydroxylase (fatty acid hydroxylase superfamily)